MAARKKTTPENSLYPLKRKRLSEAIFEQIKEKIFDGGFRPWTSGEWRWGIISAGQTTGLVLPPPLEIRVLPDSLPDVRILHPEGDRALGSKLRLPIVVDVRDDIGISEVELVSWKVSARPCPRQTDTPVAENL